MTIPAPVSLDWMTDANCPSVGTDVFFPEYTYKIPAAKSVCADCPVREQCLQFALAPQVDYGIFGGLSPVERRRVKPN